MLLSGPRKAGLFHLEQLGPKYCKQSCVSLALSHALCICICLCVCPRAKLQESRLNYSPNHNPMNAVMRTTSIIYTDYGSPYLVSYKSNSKYWIIYLTADTSSSWSSPSYGWMDAPAGSFENCDFKYLNNVFKGRYSWGRRKLVFPKK